MKIIILLLGIAFIACTEISYKEPQPRGVKSLSELPSKLYGKYLMDNDTVYFFNKGLRGYEDGKEEFVLLSDTIIFKEYKGNYFFSYRDGNVWLLRILRLEKNGDISFLSMDDVPEDEAQRKIFLEKLSKETPVVESESRFVIDPSPRKLNKLVKKGFFKQQEKAGLKRIE